MVTYAKIRFLNDKKKIRITKIGSITKFIKNPPKHSKDFNQKKIYLCKWKDDNDPKIIEIPVQIAELASKYNDLNDNKNAIWYQIYCLEFFHGNFNSKILS